MTHFILSNKVLTIVYEDTRVNIDLSNEKDLTNMRVCVAEASEYKRAEIRIDETVRKASNYLTFKGDRLKVLLSRLDDKNHLLCARLDLPLKSSDLIPLLRALEKI